MYQVIDKGTGAVMGTYKTRQRAQAKRDKLDNAYGAYHYYVKAV